MKLIKSFEEFSNGIQLCIIPDSVVENIKDICLELQDDGFNVIIDPTICHIYSTNGFKYDQVSEVIERVKDYISSEGYNITVYKDKRSTFSPNRFTFPLGGVNIEFEKI